MADPLSFYLEDDKTQPGTRSNFNVDYVIHYKLPTTSVKEKEEAEAAFIQLINALSAVGFATEVRPGGKSSLLVFTKIASEKLLTSQVYRYRIQDWLFGVRTSAPNQDLSKYLEEEPVSEAERLRLTYLLITKSKNEGGAGITAKVGKWKYVDSIFPLHDHDFNRRWIKAWSSKYFLDEEDLNRIRDKFGERVAFYFAFLQSYFAFLLFPAAFGFAAWLILGKFSWFYAVVNALWSVVFFEHWKTKEVDLAVRWGVRGVSRIQHPRPQFQFEREAQDPVTGEIVRVYSPFKRLARQLLQIPFALACVVVLGGLIVSCFSIEVFITEIYTGPFKQYLTFLPTVLLTIFMPTFSGLLTHLAEKLTKAENYETHDAHQASFIEKIFVLNFITSYLPIFLTAFVYVPFGKLLVPYLDVFKVTAQSFTTMEKPVTKSWEINPDRLTTQVIYFTVTAQIVNFLTEVIVPYAKRKVFKKVQEVQSEFTGNGHELQIKDHPDEADFLKRVRNEAELDAYDVTVDYREMVVQFGYLSLFSVIWPLAACSFLVNNWVEARSDAMKIAIGSQRPVPWRADSIGPWLNSLGFLSWLGSITSAALVYLFNKHDINPDGTPWDISAWALLLSILFAEHIYFAVQLVVRSLVQKLDNPGLQKERAERYALRKKLLEQTFGSHGYDADLTEEARGPGYVSSGERITREALEEEARVNATKTPEQLFWLRQRGAAETIEIGRGLMAQVAAANQTKS
ncbi:calcium-activated chloride channel-domain-containing protein [Neurospora hispaniola]|uniref:Calcium-activated chloride channel-domain-containing protein n=1 Tax=Neurospora hispaniola TaxID=588809 RepID=A0AAJ0MNR9_9PEZI|nr:calcium-activated chloride channel-domain-containing protein [Neurospora hispaniola]